AMRSSSAAPATPTACPPELLIAATASSTAAGSRPLMATPAPRSQSNSTTARPIPRLPPATTALRPTAGSGRSSISAHDSGGQGLGRRHLLGAGATARPPERTAQQDHQGRQDQAAHNEGVQQQTDADGDADLRHAQH